MSNLVFCLNATMPIFILMILGYVFNKIGFLDDVLASKMNKFVFKAALPVLLFKDLSIADFETMWDTKFVLFCFGITLLCIIIMALFSSLIEDKSLRGEFIQGGFRSSAALLGVAYVQNIYGTSGAASLMIISSVPLYNVASVIILSFLKPGVHKIDKETARKTLKDIATNPLIIGAVCGILWSILRIPQTVIFTKTIESFSAISTPLGLMALGASFNFKEALSKMKLSVISSSFKLIIFVGLFLPVAVRMGFRYDKLVSIIVMLGAATTVSSFVMAKSMGHEGTLSSSTVMITTLFSGFTLTVWFYIVKSFGLI